MKYLVFILLAFIVCYGSWQILTKEAREALVSFVKQHVMRIGVFGLILLLLFLIVASQQMSIQVF
jgi:DMSO/TMAO reductase YedYZ heme-binding membrane subunit